MRSRRESARSTLGTLLCVAALLVQIAQPFLVAAHHAAHRDPHAEVPAGDPHCDRFAAAAAHDVDCAVCQALDRARLAAPEASSSPGSPAHRSPAIPPSHGVPAATLACVLPGARAPPACS
jgi:hypothetical protein